MPNTLAATVRAAHVCYGMDEELRRKEAQLQDLLRETEQTFFSVDVNGINLETFETELEMLGYKRCEKIPKVVCATIYRTTLVRGALPNERARGGRLRASVRFAPACASRQRALRASVRFAPACLERARART